MKLCHRVVPILVMILAASGIGWCSAPIQDDIGACLARPDGTRVTLPGEEVLWRGRSGKSFADQGVERESRQPTHGSWWSARIRSLSRSSGPWT